MKVHWSRKLQTLGACSESIVFARTYRSFNAAWKACDRSDWMLWYLSRTLADTQANRETLAIIAIRIVREITNRELIPAWETWADGYLSGKDRTQGAAASAEAAVAAEASAEAAAAGAARAGAARAAWARAAWAASAAARAAGAAAGAEAATRATWAAAEAAGARAARAAASIVREYYPRPTVKA